MKTSTFTRIKRWVVVTLLLLNAPPPFLADAAARSGGVAGDHPLIVDTYLDLNDPAHQACTVLPDDCSLRGAISKANADANLYYQINLQAGTYALNLPGAGEDSNASGDLDVHTSLLLSGSGANLTLIHAQQLDRVIHIFPGASLRVQNITISGGMTQKVEAGGSIEKITDIGGGIYNLGFLELTDSSVRDNQTGPGNDGIKEDVNGGWSGDGGGIYNAGSLALKRTVIQTNSTGTGGSGFTPIVQPDCGGGGKSGDGGGIYNTGFTLLVESQLVGNANQGGGAGGLNGWKGIPCRGGEGGSGGGIYSTGRLQIKGSIFILNRTGAGGNGTKGGDGGGIFSASWLQISDSQIVDNQTFGGSRGGDGGGIYSAGWLEISNSHVNGNSTGSGISAGMQGSSGGGIYAQGHTLISDSMISGNQTGKGGSGQPDPYDTMWRGGPGGNGGGIANMGNLSLINTSLDSNRTGAGGSGFGFGGGSGGLGGGLYNAGTAELQGSLVTGNLAGSGGNSLSGYVIYESGGQGGSGGGIFNAGDLSLSYSPVISNTAGQGGGDGKIQPGQGGPGGGIYNAGKLVTRFSPVTGNSAGDGGLGVTGGNPAIGKGGDGGGIYNNADLDMLGTIVMKNQTGQGSSPQSYSGYGGGIYAGTASSLKLASTLVAENSIDAGGYGSGLVLMSSASLNHTTLARNSGGDGSAIYFSGPTLTLTNTILVSHTVGITTTGSSVQMDSTLWGSGAWANLANWGGTGSFTSTHELYSDPGFADPAQGDYHLLPVSPAVDQGLLSGSLADIDNQPRPNPSTHLPDLGADEYWQLVPISQVSIGGTSPVAVSYEVTFTASVSPSNTTPNLAFLWSPQPERGQLTDSAVYEWFAPGVYTITLSAWNAAGSQKIARQVDVIYGSNTLFLPGLMYRYK